MAVADITSCDFTFRALDDDAIMTRFDALFTFADDATDRVFLVYADAEPDARGETGTYASLLVDPGEAVAAQEAVEAGSHPKKPPEVHLSVIERDADWDLVDEALVQIDAEDD